MTVFGNESESLTVSWWHFGHLVCSRELYRSIWLGPVVVRQAQRLSTRARCYFGNTRDFQRFPMQYDRWVRFTRFECHYLWSVLYLFSSFTIKFVDTGLKRSSAQSAFPPPSYYEPNPIVQSDHSQFQLEDLSWYSIGRALKSFHENCEQSMSRLGTYISFDEFCVQSLCDSNGNRTQGAWNDYLRILN